MRRLNRIVLQKALSGLGEVSSHAFEGATEKAHIKLKEVVEMLQKEIEPPSAVPTSILDHIHKRVLEVERAVKCVCVLQFAIHPAGMAMILRCYRDFVEREYSFTDVITASEMAHGAGEKEIERIDVLFNEIHKALNSVQVIKAGAGGLLH